MRKLRRLAGGRLLPCVLLALFFASAAVALALWLPRLMAPAAAAGALLSLGAALTVAASDEPPEYKISKLVLLLALPYTGAILCLWWKSPDRPASARRIPAAGERAEPRKFAAEGRTERLLSLASRCGLPPARADGAEYFCVGADMAKRLLSDLKGAKRYAFLQYFIVERGVFFNEVAAELSRAAKRGVDVRLLYDDFGCALTLPRDFAKTMARLGIAACPVRKLRFPTRAAGRRDHTKLAVIDGEIAYTGGINLADEYIGARLRFGHWKDTAVRLTGEPALRFADLFARAWTRERPSSPLPPLLPPERPQKSRNGPNAVRYGLPCAVFADGADGGERVGRKVIDGLVSSAERTLYVCTPYLAPDGALLASLCRAAESGVDVRLLLPRIPDKKLPYRITLSYARELAARGVGVRLYTAGFLHAKSLAADGKYALVSSYNLDFRSLWLQAECGVLLESEGLAARAEEDFCAAWKDGSPLPAASPFARALGKLLRLFAPLV